jgi:quercetin dioxygenase-like cupin family protein
MRETKESLPETIIRRVSKPWIEIALGVSLCLFASEECGAEGFSTALATFAPGATLPYHIHEYSEASTVVSGTASVLVEGRSYLLRPRDCIHIPKGVPHSAVNLSSDAELVLLVGFGSSTPARELVGGGSFPVRDFGLNNPQATDPEHIERFDRAEKYELAGGTKFCDLFAGHLGAVGICGGYGEFMPSASLPCHVHDFGESITIVRGTARCEVMGRHYYLSDCDTAFIPRGYPHRFINDSKEMMAMLWVYGGHEPTRELVDQGYCDGSRPWSPSQRTSISPAGNGKERKPRRGFPPRIADPGKNDAS